MSKSLSRLTMPKFTAICIAAIIAVFGFVKFSETYQKASASAFGPSPSFTNAPSESNCTACHTEFPVNSGTGNMVITGLPANYLPGQQIPVTVTVNQSGAVNFGFQLTSLDIQGRQAGTYAVTGGATPETQIVSGLVNGSERRYVEHTGNGVTPTQFDTKSWTFTWTAPALRVGKVSFYSSGNGANGSGSTNGDYIYTTTKATLSGSALSNFDADGISDVAVFRPSNGVWYTLNSSNGNSQAVQFGLSGDRIVPGDFDGDGKTDFAVFRPSTGVWYLQTSSGGVSIIPFGQNGDVPVSGDYDGDLKSDLAVWRPSTGVWYIYRSSNATYDIRQFGLSSDKIAQGDFDADGKTDIAVWRPSNGAWYVQKSTGGVTVSQFGLNGDRPVQGDYDGDGKTDFAVFRPSDSRWYVLGSSQGFSISQFGTSTDQPVPADYDGDGKTDFGVYRNGVWYVFRSSDFQATIASFGLTGDIPIPSGYISQ